MKAVLIAGAGYLGLALAEQLKGQGVDIHLARRSPQAVAGAKTLQCDFTDPATLVGLPDVDAIYYAVAADDSSDASYEKAYFTGVRNLIEAYRRRRPAPRFYLASSTSAYAASEGEIVTEESLDLADRSASRFIVAGERLLMDSGLDGAIVRYGGIYGPGRTSLLRRIRDRLEVMTPNAVQYMNRINREDAAGVVAFLMERSQGMAIFNAVDQAPSVRDEVISWVARELGMSLEDYPTDPELREPKAHRRVLSMKLQDLGYRYRYPTYREGYAPLLATL